MKKLIVTQVGSVQVEAERRFVIEVPDGVTEEQAEHLLEELSNATDDEGMEWMDDAGRGWLGYDVESVETEVSDPDTVLGGPSVEGLKVIRFDVPADDAD